MYFLEESENRTQERERKGTQSSHLSDTDQSRLVTKSEAEAGDAKKDNLTRQGQESQLGNVSYNVCISARVCMFIHFFKLNSFLNYTKKPSSYSMITT